MSPNYEPELSIMSSSYDPELRTVSSSYEPESEAQKKIEDYAAEFETHLHYLIET